MLDMRLRIPELMATRKPEPMRTAYALQKASGGRLSMTNATHLVDKRGNISRVDMRTLEILCDVFGVGPGELLERDAKSPPALPPAAPAVHKPSAKKPTRPRKPARR